MIQAAPLVLSFARAVPMLNKLVGAVGITELGNRVNNYIQENPDESAKIVSMIMPPQGIANALKNKSSEDAEEVQESEIFMNKEKISLEDLDEMTDEEAADLPDEDKAELMKQAGKRKDRELSIATSEKLGLSGPGKEKIDIEREIDERVDPGGIQKEKKGYDFRDYIPKGAYKKRYADGGAIGIEVLFEEKKPRKDFSIGGQARPTDRVYDPRANVEDFTKALKSVSAGTTYQQQRQAQDYARQDASRRLSEAMRSGNQSGIQSILQGIGGSTSMGGMQFNRSGNRITSIPATGPGRDKILNAMAQQMLNYTPSYQSLKPQPRDNLGLLMQDTIITDQMKSPAEMDAIRDRVLAAQKAQEQSYFMTDPVTGKKYSTEAEAIDDLGLVTYNQRFADGGRVGLFMGGSPLDGQALAIYNSMNAYGFSDQEIANALQEQGLYTPGGSDTPDTPPTTIQPVGLQTGNDNFSPYNPDPNKIQSFKTDSRIAAANEADIRNKQLTSMGINDPFANEASLSGAYYGDMPTDTSNQIGKQSMFAKAKQGLTGLMDNPLVNLISSSTPFGMAKNLFKGIGSKMPVNQRAIQEDIMGNLGFAVNDIGQIVSTGDYDDESGDNVMAGYNLNRMTVDTFKNRIDKIRNRKAAQTASSIARIAAIQEAQRKFELGEKLKADALLEAQLKKAQKEIEAKGYKDYGQGGASQATQDSYAGSDGSYAGASTQDYGGGEKDGGIIGYRNGGLATMFKEKR